MNTSISQSLHTKCDRLLANIVLLHEVTAHKDMHAELPKYLAAALGASSVSVAFVEVASNGQELQRSIHSTNTCRIAEEGTDSEWLADLLRETTSGGAIAGTTRFTPPAAVHALYPIDIDRAIAFQIKAPAAVHMITDDGRAFMLVLLSHIARTLGCQASCNNSRVRSRPLLNALTKAEWRVLIALDSEATEKEIASNLSTSVNTLHSHIKSIYRRLGVQSRLSALAVLRRAERQSLIEELQAGSLRESDGPASPSGLNTITAVEHRPTPATIATLSTLSQQPHRSSTAPGFFIGDTKVG
jgi:DNA-binding NarL/FixJ family response regulator